MTHGISVHSPHPARLGLRERFLPSPGKLAINTAFIAGGVVTGAIGWSGHPLAFPIGVAFPALWAFAPTRTVAGLVAAAHFLGASRGLPIGTMIFFGEQLAIGLAFWIAASVLFVAVHSVLWTAKGGWQRPVRYAVAAVLMSVPPFGIMGWASPITAAGTLFPGWGWWGLAFTGAGLLAMTTRAWPVVSVVLGGVYVLSAVNWEPPSAPEGVVGIDTSFQFTAAGQYADYQQHIDTIAMVKNVAGEGAKAAVLPESALGLWGDTTKRLWQQKLAGLDIEVNGGAAVIDRVGYDNVMMEITADSSRIVYKQRMPVPASMWQPWTTGGAHAHFFADPVVKVAGYRAVPLICYEQLIVWPVLQSMLHRPDIIIATGNGWWVGGTNIVAIQKASAQAWASLFGLPLVIAFNT